MNVSRFRDFFRFSIIRHVVENLKQSLKINQKPKSKPLVRLKHVGSQGPGLGAGLGDGLGAHFLIYAGYTPGQQWPTDLGDNLAGGLNGCSGTDFH